MANEYDKILRENFSIPKPVLLRQLIPENIVSIRPIVPKVRQPILEREADIVADVITVTGEHFLLHIEWQSSNDANMAGRMAMYDLMLNQTYKLPVLGAVLYLGNDPLKMNDTHTFFNFRYQCKMIDVRQLEPSVFLQSDDAGEVIFSILTGTDNHQEKQKTIQEIFAKL